MDKVSQVGNDHFVQISWLTYYVKECVFGEAGYLDEVPAFSQMSFDYEGEEMLVMWDKKIERERSTDRQVGKGREWTQSSFVKSELNHCYYYQYCIYIYMQKLKDKYKANLLSLSLLWKLCKLLVMQYAD